MVWIAKGVFGLDVRKNDLATSLQLVRHLHSYCVSHPPRPFLSGHERPLNPLLLFTGSNVGTCVRNDKTLICSRAEKQIEGSLCYVTAICQTVFPVVAFMQLR